MSGSNSVPQQSPFRVTLAAVSFGLALFALYAVRGAHIAAAQDASPVPAVDSSVIPALRGLYLNRFAAQSGPKLHKLLAMADSTEINAFVVDMKDEFGLNFKSSNPRVQRNAGTNSGYVRHVQALVDTIKAHGLTPIARIVVFKDTVAASLNRDWTILGEDSLPWRDKDGQVWVNAYNHDVWEYNLSVAEELAKYGFTEIQFDYVRFPEPYASLAKQVFPGAKSTKPEILREFLALARSRLGPLGVRTTADVFGMTTSARGTLEVGQNWERLSPVLDVILPMVYPSHYPKGILGIEHPNADPYGIVKIALDTARARDHALGLKQPEHVRPWLQAFTLGRPPYGVEEVKAQKRAVYDAGYSGWVLWNPGSNYDLFAGALAPRAERP